MFKIRISPNTEIKRNISTINSPIHSTLPDLDKVSTKQEEQQRFITSLMFWGLGIVAMTLFYKTLSSLML